MNKVTEALSHLLAFNFGVRSNLAKRTLNNRDAVAFLLFSCGPMKMREIVDAMNVWRNGSTERKREKCSRFVMDRGDPTKFVRRAGTKTVPKMGFTYMFNSSRSGGYGCVGANVFTKGIYMASEWSGFSHLKHHVPGENYLRRTYWYRSAPGLYAPTLECAKRMSEIAHFFE